MLIQTFQSLYTCHHYSIGYSVGNLVGPQTFLTSEAPAYSVRLTFLFPLSRAPFIQIQIYLSFWCCVAYYFDMQTAIKTMLCCYAIDALLFLAYGLYCRHLNRLKAAHLASYPSPPHPSYSSDEKHVEGGKVAEVIHTDEALADLTDLRNPHFVYIT